MNCQVYYLGVWGFFLAVDDNLYESPFRTFITGDFIA